MGPETIRGALSRSPGTPFARGQSLRRGLNEINGSTGPRRPSRAGHTQRLKADAEQVIAAQHRATRPAGITPSLIFRLRLAGNLDETQLERFGLHLVASDEQKTLVVFASEQNLAQFLTRVGTFGSPTGFSYAEVGNIEGLDPITPADRVGRRLAVNPLAAGERNAPVDVELWHPGTNTGALARINELTQFLQAHKADVRDHYIGGDLVVARCRVDQTLLDSLLEIDYVREVDRIPTAAIGRIEALDIGADAVREIGQAPEDATGVLGGDERA